ncbi:S-layer protein [Candidatus Woesearchaeota archaeon]|nr:S-layer protein [Candidatus Woesearchaeota archaeon]
MQRLKRAVKRIAAIGTGVAMLGATMTGALAQPDVADYPAPFIVDGRDSGNIAIVVGADAKSADTIGALDIAKQLQFDSKVCVADPGSSGGVSVSGDSVEISTPSDLLELRESIGDVRNTLTDVEVAGGGLAGGRITTDEGSTEFNQYLRFFDSTNALDFVPRVNYTENEGIADGFVGDYLYIKDSDDPTNISTAFFEYELEFESGLESAVSSGTLPDLEDEEVLILGTTYTIVDTVVDTSANEVELTFLGGAVYDVLGEGETKTYTIDEQDFEVTVMIIEDVTPATVTFEINGEITKQLKDSQTTTLDDGTLVGVSDIVLNEAGEAGSGDIVEMYLGATKLVLKDTEYIDTTFVQNVEIDNEDITNAMVQIIAAELSSATKLEISTIRYRLSADALNGDDVWVEPGHGVREYLDEPQGLLGTEWDIRYEGLDDVQTSIMKFDPSGDDEYKLIFENMQGLVYNVPFMTNEGGTFKYGNDDRDFVFEEGTYASTGFNVSTQIPTIGHLDYFVLSDVDETNNYDNEAISHVMRYGNYDANNKELKFEDMATGDVKLVTYSTTSPANGTLGSGDLNVGGTTYKVYVANASAGIPPLMVDLDADATVSAEEVRLTINGGGIVDLGDHAKSTGGTWNVSPGVEVNNWTGVWSNTGETMNGTAIVNLTTLQEDFDEDGPETVGATDNEHTWFTVRNMPGNEIGINKSDVKSNGGINSILEDQDNNDYYSGMTDYGALVTLYDASASDNPETLTIEYPLSQRGAKVFVTFGETTTTKTAAGESCTVADLAIANLLDSDVQNPADYNLIIAGGPCANTIAADLFMTCDAWTYGPGEAVITMVENGDNVALLVAGTDGTDTRRAAKMLSDYADEELSGSEVMV